jgi:hypothetical protein
MFIRVANSLCCEWLSRHPNPRHFTTTDFRGVMVPTMTAPPSP